MTERLMPDQVNLGENCNFTLGEVIGRFEDYQKNPVNPCGLRVVCGFFLPPWQRGLVWSQEQKIAFMESLWRGVPVGTYSYNQTRLPGPLDDILIDGQQRMSAVEDYLLDKFPVFGYKYSEITPLDKRLLRIVTFGAFLTHSDDEEYLKNYYNLMNFGGVAHKKDEKA